MRQTDGNFLRDVARKLRYSLYARDTTLYRRIFLCGANPSSGRGVRNILGEALTNAKKVRYWYDRYVVYYPEELFDGLMSGPNRYDLLTLENLLAEAVDAVVLIIESPGAIAELGAFVNHPDLRKKLVVVQDEKFRRAKSFIGHGLVRLLQDKGEGTVLFLPLEKIYQHVEEIRDAIDAIARACPVRFDLSNVFHAPSLIIPCLFLLEELTREEIGIMVAEATGLSADKLSIVVSGAISVLLAERSIAKERGIFRLTDAAAKRFITRGRWSDRVIYNMNVMDRIRIDVLTRQRRRLRSWALDG